MSRPFSAEPLMIIATETRVTARPTPAAASMPTAVRPCRKEDLARVAEIHKARFALPGTLLGQLSPTLIAGLYASFFGRATFLVHATGGDVDGFVLGGSSRAMTRCKLSFFRKYALLCIVDVVRRPQLWTRAFHAFVKLIGDWSSSASETAPREEFRMVSIAVSPRATRKGVGTALVQGFEAAMGEERQAYSLNVLKTNASAIRFYEQLGFHCIGETAKSWTLRKALGDSAAIPKRRAA